MLFASTVGATAQSASTPEGDRFNNTGPGPDGDSERVAEGESTQQAAPIAPEDLPEIIKCTVAVPAECADAGLNAAECMAFYRTRIRDTRDILGRTLDFCDQTGAISSQRDSENEIARLDEEVTRLESDLARMETLHRQELLELRQEYATRISDNLARIDRLAAERDQLATELAALQETPEEKLPDASTGDRAVTELSDIPDLGTLLMDPTTVPEVVLPIDEVCASSAPGRPEIDTAISSEPQLFSDLSPIQRARIIEGLASGTDAMEVVALAWRSTVRADHIEARRTAAAHLCRTLPFSCIERSDRARLCE